MGSIFKFFLSLLLLNTFIRNGISTSSPCGIGNIQCHSGSCLPDYSRCDGERDCPDGDDEDGCPTCAEEEKISCFGNQPDMLASHPACISHEQKCNGFHDCPNGFDEDSCDESAVICTDDQFSCGNNSCIPLAWKCDDDVDCDNGKDETVATCSTCTDQQFHCSGTSTCVSKSWRCDGEDDCPDGDDERECAATPVCADDEFTCVGTPGHSADDTKCIVMRWRCDGEPDCLDGSDEADCDQAAPANNAAQCTSLEFPCNTVHDGVACILSTWKCDGQSDCGDGSDETPQYAGCTDSKIPVQCVQGYFKCEQDNFCISDQLKCNGEVDCLTGGEDEANCNDHGLQADGVCSDDEFTCLDDGRCVDKKFTCDGTNNCGDSSDETSCTTDPCPNTSNYPCGDLNATTCDPIRSPNQQHGQVQYYSYTCGCKAPGFAYDSHSKTCIDINECQGNLYHCDQICVNTNGSYYCACEEGFSLERDNQTCKTRSEHHPTLLFTNNRDIRQFHFHDSHKEYAPLVISKMATAIDFDVRERRVFYSDNTERKIYKFLLPSPDSVSGPKTVDMKIPNIHTASGMAYDWIYDHLYWTDSDSRTINMATIEDGPQAPKTRIIYQNVNPTCVESSRMNSTSVCIQQPGAVAVHPQKGWIFWSDMGINPHIARAGLDGSSMEKFVFNKNGSPVQLLAPRGLTLDLTSQTEQQMFWIDSKLASVFSCSLENCMGSIGLVHDNHEHIQHPYSITVFENFLYWSDHQKIVKAPKHGGGNVTALVTNVANPRDLKVFHNISQPSHSNVCQNLTMKCDHFCTPKPWKKMNSRSLHAIPIGSTQHTCLCDSGFALETDGRTCSRIFVTATHSTEAPKPHQTNTGVPNVGIVAIIACICVLVIGTIIGVALFVMRKRRRAAKAAKHFDNFENPVYRKTTTHRPEDKLELPANEYQPDHSIPAVLVPLTSYASTSSHDDMSV